MADGDAVLIGKINTASGGETRINRPAGTPGTFSFVVESENGYGVVGSSGGDIGVWGGSQRHRGVQGTSRTRSGVFGHSQQGDGVVGFTDTPEGPTGLVQRAGVWGEGNNPRIPGVAGISNATERAYGVYGHASGNNSFAGYFNGHVNVTQSVTAKEYFRAVTSRSDGSLRRVYALESPESSCEDFGRGEVVEGRAEVELDKEFAAMVRTDDYHVFLTAEGDSQGLYVSARSPEGFEVREQQGGTSNLTFSYRVVAKRSDTEAQRLQKIEAPAELADVPDAIPEGLEVR